MINCIIGSLIGTLIGLIGSFYIIRYQITKDFKRDTEKALRDGILYGCTAVYIKNED